MSQYRVGDGNPVFAVWPDFISTVQPVEAGSEPLLLMFKTQTTATDIVAALQDCPGGESFHWTVEDLVKLASLFSMNRLGAQWDTIVKALDPGSLNSLKAVGSLFASHGVLPTPSDDELDEVSALLEQLWDEIAGADLDEPTRSRFLGRVADLQRATSQSRLFGQEQLRRTVLGAAAELIVDEAPKANASTANVIDRLFGALSKIADVLGMAAFVGLSLGAGPQATPAIAPIDITINQEHVVNIHADDDIIDAEIVEP